MWWLLVALLAWLFCGVIGIGFTVPLFLAGCPNKNQTFWQELNDQKLFILLGLALLFAAILMTQERGHWVWRLWPQSRASPIDEKTAEKLLPLVSTEADCTAYERTKVERRE